ncbi:MAG: hypothetical protein BroJett038_29940 [Chloroflexota bacterium]|jgi:hypothetical protein|nr:MAG: hypothetical protein BroJett038_29940 [Chloroflexota bacterium]
MSFVQSRIVISGLLFAVIILSGLWLSNSGRPINVIALTAHKLIALGTLVLFVLTLHQMNQAVGLSAIEFIGGGLTVLFFVVTIIMGGLLSTENPMPKIVLTLHQIGPILAALSTAATLYLLLNHKP